MHEDNDFVASAASTYESIKICTGQTCGTPLQKVDPFSSTLYNNWTSAEGNVFGFGGGSEASFNTGGASMTLTITLTISTSGNNAAYCSTAASTTGESNNLLLGTCTGSGSNNYISFYESINTNYYLTMGYLGSGSVSPASGNYKNYVSISAMPAVGNKFCSWDGTGPDSYTGTTNHVQIGMGAATSETAIFVPIGNGCPTIPLRVGATSPP
jgi:hypothetical protein